MTGASEEEECRETTQPSTKQSSLERSCVTRSVTLWIDRGGYALPHCHSSAFISDHYHPYHHSTTANEGPAVLRL